MGRTTSVVVAVGAAVLLGTAPPAFADGGGDPLAVTVTVDGHPITERTVAVDPAKPISLLITANNPGDGVQRVRSVRFAGTALGLTFFAYDTTAPFEVPPHGSVTRNLVLDLADLDGQATGLLPASVQLLDAARDPLGGADAVTDVRGSLWSVYGIFGIGVLALTVLAWLSALLALARHRLPANRWRRGLRFLPAGIGTGLVAVVSLSVLRLVPPEPLVEIPVVLGAAVIALVLGYLTPHPAPAAPDRDGTDDYYDEDPTVGVTTGVLDSRGLAG